MELGASVNPEPRHYRRAGLALQLDKLGKGNTFAIATTDIDAADVFRRFTKFVFVLQIHLEITVLVAEVVHKAVTKRIG